MRPIKLEIEGLQSYEKNQIIDFEKLTEYGLFGIFGNTGSGKSTVIDAITYAIYGDIVRIDGNAGKLDDLLNVNSDRLRVEFVFEIGSDRYMIERSVKTKRDSREISQSGKVNRMYKNDEMICDNTTEIKKEVDNIIGLTMDDFTRSVVLPQGKFSEFLKLSGKEKRDMLERIFELKEYGKKLIEKVRRERNELSAKMTSIDDRIKGKGDGLTPETLDEKNKEKKTIEEELKDIQKKKKSFDSEFETLGKIKKLTEEKESLNLEKDELEEMKEEVECNKKKSERAKKASPINKEVMEYNKIAANLKVKENSLDTLTGEIEGKEDNHRRLQEELGELESSMTEKTTEQEKVEVSPEENQKKTSLSVELKSYSDSYNDKIKYQGEIGRLEDEEKRLSEDKQTLEKEKKELETKVENHIVTQEIDIERVRQGLKELGLEEVKKLEKDIVSLKETLEDEIQKEEKLEKSILEKVSELKELRQKERENFAVRLAMELKEGEDCPVCGSKEHPKLAGVVDSSEDIDYEKEIEKLDKKLNKEMDEKVRLKTTSLKERLEELKEKLGDRASEILSEEANSLEEKIKTLNKKREKELEEEKNIKSNLEKIVEKLGKTSIQLAKVSQEIKTNGEILFKAKGVFQEAKSNIKKLDVSFVTGELVDTDSVDTFIKNIDERIKETQSLKTEIKKMQESKEKHEKQVKLASDEIKNLEIEKVKLATKIEEGNKSKNIFLVRIERLLEESGFSGIEDLESSILDEKVILELDEKISIYSNKVDENKIKLGEVCKKLEGSTYDDDRFSELRNLIQDLETSIQEKTKKIGSVTAEIRRITAEIEAIKGLLVERRKVEEEHDRYDELSRLFAANKFVEYLATGKLKNISRIASRRLSKISNGRYALTVDGSGSFLIVDNFNGGETRKTATLSGGESFLVSLSLALALSSQIQLKGRIQLEFFFLDEGFGTLDSTVLDRVMTSLETLRSEEKMKVGIITHVEELKERIPRKIVVHPAISGDRGSLVEMISL